MKLTDEQVQESKKGLLEGKEILKGRTGENMFDNLLDYVDTIEALQQENEQLQAQAAQVREALIIANHRMPDVGQFCACGNCKMCGATISYAGYEYCISCARKIVDEALSSTSAAYHNPAAEKAIAEVGE